MTAGEPRDSAESGRGALSVLSRHSLVYVAGRLLGGLSSILLLPVFTPLLSREDYGVMALTNRTLLLLLQLVGFQLGAAVTRHYFEPVDDRGRRRVVSTALLALASLSLAAGSLLYLGAGFLADLLPGAGHEDLAPALRLAAVILVAMVISELAIAVLKAQRRSIAAVSWQLLRLLLELTGKILLVVAFGMGVLGVFRGQALAAGVFLAGSAIWLVSRFGLEFDRAAFRSMFLFSAPMVVSGLCQFALHSADGFMLPFLSSLGELGLYDVAYMFGFAVATFILGPFLDIWYPYVFSVSGPEERSAVISRVCVHVPALLLAASLPVALFAPELIRLLTEAKFHGAWVFIPVILLAYLFWGLFQMVQTVFYVHKRTGFLPRIVGSAAVVNVLLNLLLIPLWGAMGAAVATVLSLALLALLARRAAQRLERIHVPWVRLARLALVCAVVGLAIYALPVGSRASLVVRSLALLLSLGYLAGPFLTRAERCQLVDLLRSLVKKS